MKRVLSSLVILVGLQACVLRLPGISIGTQGVSTPSSTGRSSVASTGSTSSSSQGSSSSSAPAARPNSIWATSSDEAFAAMLAPEYLGTLHEITALEKKPAGTVAVGKMGFEPGDVSEVERREEALRWKKFPGSNDLDVAVCKAVFVEHDGLPETDEDVKRLCKDGRFAGSEALVYWAKGYVKFEMLVEQVKDAAKAKALRTEFARRAGWKREGFRVHDSSRWASRLVEVPMTEWTYRTLRFASTYAKKHGLDAAVLADLDKAMASVARTECVMRPGIFVKQYEGGSTYGAPYFDYPDYREATVVDCKKVKGLVTAAGDKKALPDLKPIVGTKWLAVQPKGGWKVNRNDLGVILNQWQDADAYWEREVAYR
ncbi:MAG: hypothetical protein GQE15_21610 [Archangiaceae bacterium]|nr:hypothetical protein [Archangiaceae bacterium]